MAVDRQEVTTSEDEEQSTKPISEIASLDRLATRIAREHTIGTDSGHTHPILSSTQKYRSLLDKAIQQFRSTSIDDIHLAYAAEWMLDNYHIVQENLRQIDEDMPPGYYRQLPILASGTYAGYPRVYAIAKEITSAYVTPLEIEGVRRFLQVYQVVTPLKMGEIWALPTMMRVSILESLFNTIDRLLELNSPLVDQIPLISSSMTEHSGTEVISNSILSLRVIDREDWKDFFESISHVERLLREDPAQVYSHMDFTSRNRYREAIEELAQGSGKSEIEIARQTLNLAQVALKKGNRRATSSDLDFGHITPGTHMLVIT
jgi:cyclic beta-1,2-glucan synthetase